MINRRQLWCKHHLIRETHKYANVANASQRLATYVQVRFTIKGSLHQFLTPFRAAYSQGG